MIDQRLVLSVNQRMSDLKFFAPTQHSLVSG
jgi:hypothetical protein